jgi:hypothetical protein
MNVGLYFKALNEGIFIRFTKFYRLVFDSFDNMIIGSKEKEISRNFRNMRGFVASLIR